MNKNSLALGIVSFAAVWMLGCSSELETGYKPKALGATPSERRAYYANPFTPEAAAAGAEAQSEDARNTRRPGGRY